MINRTVSSFYQKNAQENYGDSYDVQHGFRFDALIRRFGLDKVRSQRILDVGGGKGFMGRRLDPSNDYWVVDGAEIAENERLCRGHWVKTDLDHHSFGSDDGDNGLDRKGPWDIGFCLETLEHLGNAYHCLAEMKKLVKEGGDIYISVPDETVTHNVLYPSLLWPRQNFEVFLAQMALPIQEFWHFQPGRGEGWPAYVWRCSNLPWSSKRLVFPKAEPKFINASPLECTNL